jgi:hypothetical protein
MSARWLVTTAALLGAVLGCAAASGAAMHPVLGARLSGMGEKGVVNLQSEASKGRLCWSFDLSASGVTGASIRDRAGMTVARLGSMYAAKGCAAVSAMALEELDSKPGSYRVWVDTKNRVGDLRGTLFLGMATMAHM